jgi:hypothetical protein
MFVHERELVIAQHAARQASAPSPTSVDHALVGRIGQQMLRRTIQLVRGARHGGLVLLSDVDPDAPPATLEGLRLKYRFERDEPTHRYRTLLFKILASLADGTSKETVSWNDFATSANATLEKLEHAVFEWSRVVANLAAIDGAVVLDKRFGLLGFGAEVSAELPSPSRVLRALDSEGHLVRADDIESVGTRHRAAFRFVNDHPQALAIVISHDGGVSFVSNREGDVVVWEQSISP